MFRISLFARPFGLLLRKNAPQRWRIHALFLIIIIGVVVISGCGLGKKQDLPTYESRENRNGGDDVINIADDDEAMNHAMEEAKKTLAQFDSALSKKDPKTSDFALKVIFNGEHLWIGDNWKKDNIYYGILYNDPLLEENLHMKTGDTIKIITTDITDWQYLSTTNSTEYYNDTIYGSYTTRILRSKMSKQERDDFDEQTGFIYK